MAIDIDYLSWRFWFDIIRDLVTILVWIYVWWVNRKKAVEKRFAGIEKRFTAIEKAIDDALEEQQKVLDARCTGREKRINNLEMDAQTLNLKLGHMPNHKDIKELSGRIDLLHGSLSELNGRLSGINRAVDLINEFLINKPGKVE